MTDHPFDVFALPVHPAAEEFPMLPEAELKALGADIKANGQHHPVLAGEVDRVLMVMDGRNRREACRIAGVTPDVKIIIVEDPIKRIWSENGQRRNMSKGARAMVAACIFSKPEQGKRKTSLTIKEVEVNRGSLSQARTVICYAPELVDDVKTDRQSLVDAYRIAKERKQTKRLAEDSLRRLREAAPDLADRVADEADALTLALGWATLQDRRRGTSPQSLAAGNKKDDVSVAAAPKVAKKPEGQRPNLTSDNQAAPRPVAEATTKREPQPVSQSTAAWATEREAGANIRQHCRHLIESIRRIGEELVQAKTKLSDASFSEWLQRELGCSDEDAQSFIEVRDRLKDEDTDELGAINLSVLLHIVADQPVKAAGAPQPGSLAAE